MTHQTLINAIQSRQILTFTYDGQPRTVEPHAYGLSTAGNKVIRVYQTAGRSNSGRVPDWTLMTVSKIVGLTMTGSSFSSARPGYKRGDSAMTNIYAQL